MTVTLKAVILMVVLTMPLAASAQNSTQPWFNPDLPTDQRVDAMIAQMTLTEKASQMVNQARAIPRLGIPAYNWWNEALHGVARNGYATVFPEPVGLAATFDPALVKDMGITIGTEARVKYNIVGRETGEHGISQGLDFWSPISTYSATRAGAGARRPMARTLISPARWAPLLSKACRATIRAISVPSPPPSIMRCIPDPNPRAMPWT